MRMELTYTEDLQNTSLNTQARMPQMRLEQNQMRMMICHLSPVLEMRMRSQLGKWRRFELNQSYKQDGMARSEDDLISQHYLEGSLFLLLHFTVFDIWLVRGHGRIVVLELKHGGLLVCFYVVKLALR